MDGHSSTEKYQPLRTRSDVTAGQFSEDAPPPSYHTEWSEPGWGKGRQRGWNWQKWLGFVVVAGVLGTMTYRLYAIGYFSDGIQWRHLSPYQAIPSAMPSKHESHSQTVQQDQVQTENYPAMQEQIEIIEILEGAVDGDDGEAHVPDGEESQSEQESDLDSLIENHNRIAELVKRQDDGDDVEQETLVTIVFDQTPSREEEVAVQTTSGGEVGISTEVESTTEETTEETTVESTTTEEVSTTLLTQTTTETEPVETSSSSTETVTTQPPPPLPSIPVQAIIAAPSVFGGCEGSTVTLDGSQSSGYPDLRYQWTVDMPADSRDDNLRAAFEAATNQATISLSQTLFITGRATTIRLTITDGQDRQSSTTATLTRLDGVVPNVLILGPTSITQKARHPITITTDTTLPNCPGQTNQNNTLIYEWTVRRASDGTVIDLPASQRTDKRHLTLPGRTLSIGQYIARVVVFREEDRANTNLHVTVDVNLNLIAGPIQAGIEGSNGSVGLGRDVQVNAGFPYSFDTDTPDTAPTGWTYTWTCADLGVASVSDVDAATQTGSCPFTTQTGAEIFVHRSDPAQNLQLTAGRAYRFTVTVSDGTRSSSAQIVYTTVLGTPPVIAVYKLFPSDIAQSSSGLVLKSNATGLTVPTSEVTYSWDSLSEAGTFNTLDLANSTVAQTVRGLLLVAPNMLLSGGTYRFQASASSTQGNAIASLDVPVNRAPFGGSCTAVSTRTSTSSGNAYTDNWAINAANWIDDQTDFSLRYRFSTKDSAGIETPLGTATVKPSINTILPAGVAEVCVIVEDTYLSRGQACVTVTITVPQQTASEKRQLADQLIEGDFTRLIESGDVGAAFAVVNTIFDLVSTDENSSAADVEALVEQQKRALTAVESLVASVGTVDSSLATAAISAVGQIDADKLTAADLSSTLDFMATLVAGTTVAPAFATGTDPIAMDSATANKIATFLAKALQNSAANTAALAARFQQSRISSAQPQNTQSVEDTIIALIDSSAQAMVNGLQCGITATPLEMNSEAFKVRVNRFAPADTSISTDIRTIAVGDFVATIPSQDVGTVDDCYTVEVVEFNTAVSGSDASELSIVTKVLASKLFNINTNARVDHSGAAMLAFTATGTFNNAQYDGNDARCTSYDGTQWTSEGCATTQDSGTQVQCSCPYYEQHAIQMVPSSPGEGQPPIAAIAGGVGGAVALLAVVGGATAYAKKKKAGGA